MYRRRSSETTSNTPARSAARPPQRTGLSSSMGRSPPYPKLLLRERPHPVKPLARPDRSNLRLGARSIRGWLASPDLGDRRVEEEVQEPICRDPGPVLGALQLEEVGRSPEEGRRKSPELHTHNVVHRELASQLNQLTHGLVLERLQLLLSPVDDGEDVLCQPLALLDRRLGVGWDRLAVFVHVGRAVADGPDVLRAGYAHVLVRLDTLLALQLKVQVLRLDARAIAGGPDHVLGFYLLAVVEDHLVRGDLLRPYLVDHLDLELLQVSPGRPPKRRVQFLQDLLVGVHQHDLDPVQVDVRVVGRESLVGQSVELGGYLHPGRSTSYNHEGELRLRDLIVAVPLRGFVAGQGYLLEAFDHAVADALRVGEALHADAVLLDAGDAEEGRVRAQRQHQVVVGELQAAAGLQDLVLEVYALQLRPPEAGAELYQGAAQWLRDVLGLHVAAYDARHHRPVGEEILPVDDHDPDVVAVPDQLAQGLRHRVTCEPAAHDEHPVGELLVRGPLPRIVLGLWFRVHQPPHSLHDNGAANHREASFEKFVHGALPDGCLLPAIHVSGSSTTKAIPSKEVLPSGRAWSGAGRGNVYLDPVVLSEPVDVVAPVVTDVLAARLRQRPRSRPQLEGEPLDLHQPLVLGLLDLVGEDVAVGAHEIEGISQSYDVSWLCRLTVSITYPTPNCRASSAGSVVGLWQA